MPILITASKSPPYQRKLAKVIVFLFSLLLTTGSLHADFDPGSLQLAQAQPTTQLMTPELMSILTHGVSITYSWQQVANAVRYQYSLYNAAGELFKEEQTTTVSITYVVNELPLNRYSFEVIALAPEGSSEYSNSNAGVYMDDFVFGFHPPVTRSEFELSPVTTDSITIRIIDYPEALKDLFKPGIIGAEYHVSLELNGERQGKERARVGKAISPEATMLPDPLMLSFDNLIPDTNYEIVLVLSTDNRANASKPERFLARTLALPRLPRPAGLMIEVGVTTAVLTWDESDTANANTYQISLDDQIQVSGQNRNVLFRAR